MKKRKGDRRPNQALQPVVARYPFEVIADSVVDAPLVLGIYITHADKPLTIHPYEFIDLTTGRGNLSPEVKTPPQQQYEHKQSRPAEN